MLKIFDDICRQELSCASQFANLNLHQPSVLKADPSADFGVWGAFFRSLFGRPNFGRILCWNAVMLAIVSGKASILCLDPLTFSISTSTSSSFSGLWIEIFVADPGVPDV